MPTIIQQELPVAMMQEGVVHTPAIIQQGVRVHVTPGYGKALLPLATATRPARETGSAPAAGPTSSRLGARASAASPSRAATGATTAAGTAAPRGVTAMPRSGKTP